MHTAMDAISIGFLGRAREMIKAFSSGMQVK